MPRPGSSSRFALLAGAALALAGNASASNPYLEVLPEKDAAKTPAMRIANLSDERALAELRAAGVPFEAIEGPVPGVRAPVRLTGKLNGISIHSALPEKKRAESPFEILDARLALALNAFTKVLAKDDVVEIVHYTMYRPPAAPRKGHDHPPRTRHPGGLAIDIGAIKKKDGTWLNVDLHWAPKVGAKTCGNGARTLEKERGEQLRTWVCAAREARIFHYALTPHFDAAHADHLHLEVKPGVKWFIYN